MLLKWGFRRGSAKLQRGTEHRDGCTWWPLGSSVLRASVPCREGSHSSVCIVTSGSYLSSCKHQELLVLNSAENLLGKASVSFWSRVVWVSGLCCLCFAESSQKGTSLQSPGEQPEPSRKLTSHSLSSSG